MEKESYSIDEILSELRQQKAEEEKKNKERKAEEKSKEKSKEKPEEKSEEKSEEKAEEKPQEISEEKSEEPADDVADEAEEEQTEEADDNSMINILDYAPEQSEDEEAAAESEQKEKPLLTAEEYKEEPEPVKFFKTKTGKIVRVIIILLVLLIIGAGIFVGIYIHNALNQITTPRNENSQSEEWSGMKTLVENFAPIEETDASKISSLQDVTRQWFYNGSPCSSSHVLNVLFLGEDTRGEEILEDETRADAAIIVSINVDTHQITLTSVLRDTYGYWENTKGDEESGQFGKINGAMSIGDVNAYINCVENLYKINIDNYVIVNFDSFKSIVDTLGGVTLELTSAEINEINNHQVRYGGVYIEKTFEGKSGEMRLTGEQALAYCRIRKLDSDNARADRQKTCLIQIFNEIRGSSTTNMIRVANSLLPYVKTGFSGDEILSIAKYALSRGWLNYKIETTTVPYARINERGAGGIYYGEWCWKSDFPKDAYYLQMLLYGKSCITLAETRVDVLKCELYGFYKDGNPATYATIRNQNYGEVTTLETTTEEEKDSTTIA